jgi:glutathione transport system substrate-binding protein
LGSKELDERLRTPGTIADRMQSIAAANDAERDALHLFGTFPLFNGPEQIVVKQGLANYGPAGFASPDRKNVGWQKAAAN